MLSRSARSTTVKQEDVWEAWLGVVGASAQSKVHRNNKALSGIGCAGKNAGHLIGVVESPPPPYVP